MKKLTKIVATIGPACDSPEMIEKLILSGVNVFRFNFKHSTLQWHDERIHLVNKIANSLKIPIGTLIDLQGPEIRINMPFDELVIKRGDVIIFGQEAFQTKLPGLSISHPQIISHLKQDQRILADNGSFVFTFQSIKGKTFLKSESEGVLKNKKALNIPGADFPFPVLVDKDFEGLKLAERNEIDFVALSFVRTVEDIEIVKKEMKKYKLKAKLISKIETAHALKNLDQIIDASDGIMVARGDLGVELPFEQVPYYQKIIIKKSIEKGIPVITATQMLESMIEKPFPTRAEVSDIANATYDLTDAVMLSGETATGKYPLQAVEVMRKTIAYNEKKNLVDSRKRFKFRLEDQNGLIAEAAYGLYKTYEERGSKIGGFLVFTSTGHTAQLISRYRPLIPIYAFNPGDEMIEQMTIQYGIKSFYYNQALTNKDVEKDDILEAVSYLKKKEIIQSGEILIVLHGDQWYTEAKTSTVKILTVS